ncbi:hypothetical protein QBK93_22620 [Rhizobium leguminosarum]|uniref:hypothetical protein n=1 Tax=Rhizobium leguminosarum TaxID=384 RepID=UPI0024A9151B|nr:hypothetical protein [Rhizobium leguminosarum]MDI5927465.1 hypothetical protein [Rhizobium leguminosarum]
MNQSSEVGARIADLYGPDYFMNRIGYQPDTTVPLLVDAYFENQLIAKNAVIAMAILGGVISAKAGGLGPTFRRADSRSETFR